ncbi:MAG: glycosyltransferase, partial [Methanobacterium sp.]|nr:glycosyltransferase [Methanobacterium sp.]
MIILNWNSWDDTNECLESLYQIDYPNYEAVVIDNGSKDNSLEMIRKYAKKEIIPTSEFYNHIPNKEPINIIEYTREEMDATLDNDKESEIKDIDSNKKMVLIKSEKNYGFPEGCNIGMRYALKKGIKHFLLLNNDTVM